MFVTITSFTRRYAIYLRKTNIRSVVVNIWCFFSLKDNRLQLKKISCMKFKIQIMGNLISLILHYL